MNNNESRATSSANLVTKCRELSEKLGSFHENNKIPGWFKPFIELMKSFLKNVAVSFNDMEGSLAVQKAVIDALVMDRDQLKLKVEELRQYTRRNQLLIHGVDEKDGHEDTDAEVISVFEKVGVKIDKSRLNRTHRLGRKKRNSQDGPVKKRPIIVSFVSYEHKKLIYDAKKKLKGSRIAITESLSSERYALYLKCQNVFGKSNCWTYDGRIFSTKGDDKFCITTEEDFV